MPCPDIKRSDRTPQTLDESHVLDRKLDEIWLPEIGWLVKT